MEEYIYIIGRRLNWQLLFHYRFISTSGDVSPLQMAYKFYGEINKYRYIYINIYKNKWLHKKIKKRIKDYIYNG